MSDVSPQQLEVANDRRFPIGLTIATLIAFAILCVLGGWQMKRLAWKEDILARIERLKTEPARPLEVVLAASRPADLEWNRVTVECAPPVKAETLEPRYAIRNGDIAWRAMAICHSASHPNQVVAIDRGYINAASEAMTAPAYQGPAPKRVTGILRYVPLTQKVAASPTPGGETVDAHVTMIRTPSLMIVAELETPNPPGVTPAPLPAEISNRHLEYALTWFGLAVTLLFIYAAMLWRKMRS